MPPDAPLIRAQDVSHLYPAQPQPLPALEQITLALDRGEYVAIVGANGSGKSTLARHFNALLYPTRGDVWVDGANTRDPSQLRSIRRNVTMVFQNPENQFVATVAEEDVAFGPENFGVPQPTLGHRVREALQVVGLTPLRLRAPHELSAGQQQRLAVAGALALDPAALVLDEATSMLDPRGKQDVNELTGRLYKGGLLLVAITQAMDEAAQAGRVVLLDHGRVAATGTPREIFSNPDLLQECGLGLPPYAAIAQGLRTFVPDFPANLLSAHELADAIACRVRSAPAGSRSALASSPAAAMTAQPTAPAGAPIIQVRDLRHTYLRGTPRAVEALHGVDLDIYPGEIIGLVGTTGSGKSTLLQHFNGLLRPRPGEGTVVVEGINLSESGVGSRPLGNRVGLLFQLSDRQLFERYVGDDIAFGPRQFGHDRDEVRRRVRQGMERVGLGFDEFKDRRTMTLSGGEKRRVALAGVLALEPQVLVLDEPTVGLDPRGRRLLLDSLKRWRSEDGLTVVLASHDMQVIAELCDRVYVMDAGRVAFSGTPRELFWHGPDLVRLGLALPPAIILLRLLRERGLNLADSALTEQEAVQAIAPLVSSLPCEAGPSVPERSEPEEDQDKGA